MKYIILADIGNGENPILFPESFSHRGMADAHTGARAGHAAVSAGYVKITAEGVVCYDKSVSLALKPRPQDAKLIERALGMHERVANSDTAQTIYDWRPTAPPKWDVLGLSTLP